MLRACGGPLWEEPSRAQVRERALVIYGACTEEELTILCRLMFWVLTAADEALARVD